jgi:hypothetical protein
MKLITKNSIKHFLFAGVTATLLSACGGSASSYNANSYISATGETIVLGVDNPVCQEGDAVQEGKIIDSNTNRALSNVNVEIAGCMTTTDKDGYYKFSNIAAKKRVSINFEKEGYINNSEIITIDEDTSNYLEASLDENLFKWTYESKDGSIGEKLNIASDIQYTDDNGSSYNGKVTVYYSFKDTTSSEGRDSFPGTFQGIDSNGIIVPFVSYTFISIDLKNKDNNSLKINKPITITVKNVKGTDADDIPLWYYNSDRGIWIERGTANRDENGNYIFEISHTGTWSISKPIESAMGEYKGKILDADENPISHVRLEAKGKNWISKDITTDENGEFTLYVVPDEDFSLSAYDYKEKFGASFPEKLKGIASGEVVSE